MAFNIKTTHPLYKEFVDTWAMMRDAVNGEDDVKMKGIKYLPMKTGMAAITDDNKRSAAYLAYQTRAEFPELTSPAIIGSNGLIHNKTTTIELPPALEYLKEKATLDGKTLESLHEEITTQILTTGRYGLLPGVRKDGTFYIAGYNAESIINWDESDGVTDYVVLDESGDRRNKVNNQWSHEEQFLELSLDGGAYNARRYNGETPSEAIPATKKDRTQFTELPFVFINTTNLSPEPDDVPLYGLAKICFRIYRMDADYTHGLHMTSEPTPWVSGYDNPAKARENGDIPTSIGASVIWVLPKQAQAGFLEFTGQGLEAQANAISASLERAVLFGIQIISDENQAGESGKSRKLRMNTQNSLLMTINKNVAAGLQKALRNIAVWAGEDPEKVTVTPPKDLIDWTMEAQDLTALVNGWMSGGYSKRTLFDNIKRGGLVPEERSFEEEQDLIDEEGPALAGMTTPTKEPKNATSDNQDPKVTGTGSTAGQ